MVIEMKVFDLCMVVVALLHVAFFVYARRKTREYMEDERILKNEYLKALYNYNPLSNLWDMVETYKFAFKYLYSKYQKSKKTAS